MACNHTCYGDHHLAVWVETLEGLPFTVQLVVVHLSPHPLKFAPTFRVDAADFDDELNYLEG